MTSETPTSPTIPPPQEPISPYQPLPQWNLSPPRLTRENVLNIPGILIDQPIKDTEEPFHFKHLDTPEHAAKYRKYLFEMKQYLMGKYFSGRDPNGDDIFQGSTTIDGETILSSKWPCTRTYAEPDFYVAPVQFPVEEEEEAEEEAEEEEEEEEEEDDEGEEDGVGEEEHVGSAIAEITPGEISNGGIVPDKNSS